MGTKRLGKTVDLQPAFQDPHSGFTFLGHRMLSLTSRDCRGSGRPRQGPGKPLGISPWRNDDATGTGEDMDVELWAKSAK